MSRKIRYKNKHDTVPLLLWVWKGQVKKL